MYSELCPKRFQSLFSKLIAGKLHCMGTNSLQEIWACDLDIHHCIQGETISLKMGFLFVFQKLKEFI
ncbi:hypothetical protein CMV_015714 [Castanea mollissima]|uniref:Uncharacterized protein n=1 Tax=Castanea mollissima TaxID=60419 RepID=A0A8J4QUQ5_9ROSI|nr:hypothetical protein CMV_015714 [Castanea mollissima]